MRDFHRATAASQQEENRIVTKKEIVRTISDEIGLTQLQTKEIVQKTFNAIVKRGGRAPD